jgi:death on curing protein
MQEPIWVDLETLYLLHDQQLERFGGKAGVVDAGVVESSLNRLKNRHACGGDEVDLAAAYLYEFARSQGFADGNKRVAVAAALVFLHVNGAPLHVPPKELYLLAMGVSDERVRISEDQAAAWFRARLISGSGSASPSPPRAPPACTARSRTSSTAPRSGRSSTWR